MSFLRRKKPEGVVLGEVLWGVARQPGYSDTDDPATHMHATQHAFELGHDERAICGFAPPRRPSGTVTAPRPLLAVAGSANPRCPKCEALLLNNPTGRRERAIDRLTGSADVDAEAMVADAAGVGEMQFEWAGQRAADDPDTDEDLGGAGDPAPTCDRSSSRPARRR